VPASPSCPARKGRSSTSLRLSPRRARSDFRCDDEASLREAFTAARAEAEAAFGAGEIYLEKLIERGRHIEVQILCDAYGNGIHLGERECSVQRKHQKLVEESPSPALGDGERRALGEAAVGAALALGYTNAGTIEFLRARDGSTYFMEMNTRLQVEHPVSEAISGVDIVQQQIRIAANEPLALGQQDVASRGAAIECRINAEDPARDFRPSPGRLRSFAFPTGVGPGTVRLETHLAPGEEVSPHYDSLLAKLIAWAETRDRAIETMLACLRAARIEGVATTIPVHLAVLASDAFRRGDYDTSAIPGWTTGG
jgi:acetyl-CoA carboxylase biotin carboxylase subunit